MYYIVINGEQRGPYSVEELLRAGLTAESMVWRSGMADWQPAREVRELNELLQRTTVRHNGEYNAAYSYGTAQYAPGAPTPVPAGSAQGYNWLPWAIVATVMGLFSCIGLVLGIIAIVKASAANRAYGMNDAAAGDSANSTAKTLTIIALAFDGIGVIFNILFLISMIF